MKKLMFMLVAFACAVSLQASTVKWNVTNIYGVNSDGAGQTALSSRPAAGNYYVLCMLTSAMSLSDAQAAIANKDIASIAGKATYQGVTTGTGMYASSYFDGNWDANDTVEIYAVVLNASSIDKATYATVGSVASYTYADSAEDKALQVNMKTATQGTWSAVSSVPEPTSGLLMLLGMAGLALRRKRA